MTTAPATLRSDLEPVELVNRSDACPADQLGTVPLAEERAFAAWVHPKISSSTC